jgi:hypothetical protein
MTAKWRVWLLANEYVNGQIPADLASDVFVAEFDKRSEALAYVKGSGYVANVAAWSMGKAKWQTCYRIEQVPA